MIPVRRGARTQLIVEFAVSLVTWLVFLTALSLLYRVGLSVMASGGFCARGGPYQIATACSDSTVVFGSLALPVIIVAVLVNAGFVKAWGPALAMFFWPILFTTMGVAFLRGARLDGYADVMGYILGVIFIVMSGTPFLLVKVLRGRTGWDVLALRVVPASAQPDIHVTLDQAGSPVVTRDAPRVTSGAANALSGAAFIVACAMIALVISDLLYTSV